VGSGDQQSVYFAAQSASGNCYWIADVASGNGGGTFPGAGTWYATQPGTACSTTLPALASWVSAFQ
ncbi:MAG: hypothetical protein ACREQ5_27895, partial [Candidatus Dormibacteria bacterium]